MTPRKAVLCAAVVLSLPLSMVAVGAGAAAPASAAGQPDPATRALRALEADARGTVHVHRDHDGDVSSVSSSSGKAMLDTHASTAVGAARETLDAYGAAFGIDGDGSTARVTATVPSSTGGSVVRTQQVLDGVPVFGGQVVMSLDKNKDVTGVTSATADPDTSVPGPLVSEPAAGATARAAVARSEHVAPTTLTVADIGRRLYDPAVLGEQDAFGARPVWQFRVSNGDVVDKTVLVDTTRGAVVVQYDNHVAVSRSICDNDGTTSINHGNEPVADTQDVPVCDNPARVEGGPASKVADVNSAYAFLGEADQAYASLDGINLTNLIGYDNGTTTSLQATVRWCYTNDTCPFDNAFWDGRQMVFGLGYASADDVVGHELTHGYVAATSQLYAFHQSGAINESVADTIGEIIDHRNGADDDSAWNFGEDLPLDARDGQPALRSLKDPTLYGQPDNTQSSLYDKSDVSGDDGAVHANDGIGDKTAYLISQGGTFGGQTITGIDAGDSTLAKTGRLYLETIPRLTSGADWAQYGQVLESTCATLAAGGTGGFTSNDCDAVDQAVAATKLETPIASAAAQVASTCPAGTTRIMRKQDDDTTQQTFGFTASGLWQRTPTNESPNWSSSGTSSWFAWDPIPSSDGTTVATLSSAAFVVPTGQSTYLHFHQAYVLAWGAGGLYEDGARVLAYVKNGSTWTTVTLPWVNGPNRSFRHTSLRVFGGDSMGYGSSRLDLSSLAGRTVALVFRLDGDEGQYGVGWWVDDLQLYSCVNSVAAAPATTLATSGATAATVTWSAPSYVGSDPVTGFHVTTSTGKSLTLASTARSLTLSGLNPATSFGVHVAALTGGGPGASSLAVIYPGATSVKSSATTVKKSHAFALTAVVVRRGTSTRVASAPVVLQKKVGTAWRNVAGGTTNSSGWKSWSLTQTTATYYRVVTSAAHTTWASASGALKVAITR